GGGDLDENGGVVAAPQQPALWPARQIVGGREAEHRQHAERVDDDGGGGIARKVLERGDDEGDGGDESDGHADGVHAGVRDLFGPGVDRESVIAHAARLYANSVISTGSDRAQARSRLELILRTRILKAAKQELVCSLSHSANSFASLRVPIPVHPQ